MEQHRMSPYLRFIHRTGGTRHPGGFFATDILLKRVKLKKASRVLDIGCGAGHTCAHIAKNYGCFVSGIDISKEVIERARALYQDEEYFERMDLLDADAKELPFSDGYFDVVLAESVLLFIEDKKVAIEEMIRVLKPRGYLAMNELCVSRGPSASHVKEYFRKPEFMGHLLDVAEYERLVARDNLELVLQDENGLDVLGQMKGQVQDLISKKGILHLCEAAHKAFFDPETRADLLLLLRFFLGLPKDAWNSINSMLLLARKARS